jgi:hypothetical protein
MAQLSSPRLGHALMRGCSAELPRSALHFYPIPECTAAHEIAGTTKLYDRRNDQITLDEIERIVI